MIFVRQILIIYIFFLYDTIATQHLSTQLLQ